MENQNILEKLLLQYILRSRGIVHENVLLECLWELKKDLGDFKENRSIKEWKEILNQCIVNINMKLKLLNFKLIRCSHPLGKSIITKRMKYLNNGIELPSSNKFYVYVNLESTDDIKLATDFKLVEINFIKWALEVFIRSSKSLQVSTEFNSLIEIEINKILEDHFKEKKQLIHVLTFTCGFSQLSRFEDGLNISEIEKLLNKLCELKWFYRTPQGMFGMDLKLLVELEGYLINNFDLPICLVCNTLVTQGIICLSCNEGKDYTSSWHVDCFQYYLNHVSEKCKMCNNSLLDKCAYIT